MSTKPSDHFTLDIIARALERFRPPKTRFDPAGQWKSTYGVYTLTGQPAQAGKLHIDRATPSKSGFVLNISYEKSLPGHRQRVKAELHCRNDELSTPLRWTFTSQTYDNAGNPLANTKLNKSAAVREDHVEITGGKYTERIAVDAAYTVNWALFDAVQRLPRDKFKALQFAMIDHFDQLKAGQSISYCKATNVMLSEQPIRLHAYSQLGEGIVPWVYWVNDQGRLLFAVSGIEAYILNASESS